MADDADVRSTEVFDRLRQGDRDALASLFVKFEVQLKRWLRDRIDSQLQSVLNADDVIQETYADAFTSIRQFTGNDDQEFARWLQTLTRNNLLDAVKGLKTLKRGGQAKRQVQSFESSAVQLVEQLQDSAVSPSACLRAEEAVGMLRDSLQILPERYRMVVTLYDLDGRTPEEVSAACNCSVGAMYMRRARAHEMLRSMLGTEPPL